MHSEYQSNAMTEIALAMAMAFFSIMVLAMLSMGSALQAESNAETRMADGIHLGLPAAGETQAGAARDVAAEEVIVYWRGRFFDAALEPVTPAAYAGRSRLVLAIAPDLSISEAMAVREQIAADDLEVTALDARWMQTLEERDP